MKRLFVVGLGSGGRDGMTLEAKKALEQSEVICGYTAYADLIREDYPEKEYLVSGMTKEVERCHMALLAAQDGKTTAMICSGDAGVYGMAGLVLSLAEKYPETEVVIVAGVTAALSGAARLGAPLMNDFAVISLSDLLTPKDVIEKRLRAAAAGDFSICLYNPSSKKRADYLSWACRIVSEYYAPDTPCGWVRMIGRQDEEKKTCTLQELTKEQVDMFTTVFIGSSRTSFQNGLLVTKRGYEKRVAVNRAGGKEKLRILLFGGTTEGRELAQRLLTLPVIFKVSVATPYGEELLQDLPQATILAGRILCLKLLLQQQPVASDLRQISAALKMITDMERIGDQAEDIAEIIGFLNGRSGEECAFVGHMARAAISMVTGSVDAFVRQDVTLAHQVIAKDDVVDEDFRKVKATLIDWIAQRPDDGEYALDLLMIAKYFERIGDHATNIAGWVVFAVTGAHEGEEN